MSQQSRRPLSSLLLALLAGALMLAGCGGDDDSSEQGAPAAESGKEPATVSVALDWFPNPDHVSLYYAQENGMFEEQAVTAEFKTPSDPTAGLKLVAAKEFDLAIYYQPDMFFAQAEGLPVVAVGALVPTPLNSLIAQADSKVKGLDTIKGSTIGHSGGPFNEAIFTTIRDQLGLAEGDIKAINVGFDLVPALLSERVDAVTSAYFNIEGTHIRSETGEEPTIIKLEELGVPHYDELNIVANSERLKNEPEYADAVKRFLAAVAAGQEGAQKDEAGTIEIMKDVTEYKDEEIEGMVPDTLPLLTSPKGLAPLCYDIDGWSSFGDWMVETKMLDKAGDVSTLVTNDYLEGC